MIPQALVELGGYYDPTLPDQFAEFSFDCLKWPEGHLAGEPVVWADWQNEEIIGPALGWRWEATGLRIVHTCLLISARGTGKTMLAGGFGAFGLCGMNEPNPLIEYYAVSKEQAQRMFWTTVELIRSGSLSDRNLEREGGPRTAIHESPKKIRDLVNDGWIHTRTGDAEAEVGSKPSIQIMDEFLSQRDRNLWGVMLTAVGKRPEWLTMALSTPSPKGIGIVAHQEWEKATRIKKRQDKGIAERWEWAYLPVLHTTTDQDDPGAEETWRHACPAIDAGYFSIDTYREEWEDAQINPNRMREFLAFRCARWIGNSPSALVDMSKWDGQSSEMPDVDGWEVYAGLDVSETKDLTAFCLLWWDPVGNRGHAVWWHWVADTQIQMLREATGDLWDSWMADESTRITECADGYIDPATVAKQVGELCKKWGIKKVGLDTFKWAAMSRELKSHRLEAVQLTASNQKASQALRDLAGLAAEGRLGHNGDLLARWNVSNSAVTFRNHGEVDERWKLTRRKDRPREKTRIDSTSALQMTIDMRNKAHENPPPPRTRVRRILGVHV